MAASSVDSLSLTCPQCGSPIAPEDATCGTCGADIALAAFMAERALIGRATSGTGPLQPVSVEQLVPRLGEYLVGKGHVTEAQLQKALARQASGSKDRPTRRLGDTLVAMGAITRETLDRVIAQRLLELQAALVEANHDLEKRVAARTAELEAALRKLTEFNQLKANFVANISHELRTPLTQIKGYNSLLVEAALGPLTPDQKDALRITTQAIERLERLISDLISYSATAKGELTLHLTPVSAPIVIARAMEKSNSKAQKQNVTLRPDFPPGLPPVMADEEKLFWVVLQLLDNAIKFTTAGGQVTVSAAPHSQRVLISVRDTGIGIAPSRLAEIFEPFQQLDGSSTRRYGGTGLGLALVRRIVEAHGSEVRAESQEGQGSTFAFALAQATSGQA